MIIFGIGMVESETSTDGTEVCPCHPEFNMNSNVNIPPFVIRLSM